MDPTKKQYIIIALEHLGGDQPSDAVGPFDTEELAAAAVTELEEKQEREDVSFVILPIVSTAEYLAFFGKKE